MKQRQRAYRISILGMFLAIILVQNFVPFLGYIPLGVLSITILHITVIIAAIVLGPAAGAFVGLAWGLIDWIRAFVAPTSPLAPIVFTNPLISVVPRVLVGVVAGLLFKWLVNRFRHQTPAMVIAAVAGALTNTILVLGLIYLFYAHQAAGFYKIDISRLMPYLLAIVGTNGVPEAIAAGIIAPFVSVPLLKLVNK